MEAQVPLKFGIGHAAGSTIVVPSRELASWSHQLASSSGPTWTKPLVLTVSSKKHPSSCNAECESRTTRAMLCGSQQRQWHLRQPSFASLSCTAPTRAKDAKRGLRIEVTADDGVETVQLQWSLQPIGDGDCSHLDAPVPRPEMIEISADVLTVGRVPGSVDVVIPVATVSGVHARLEKNMREGFLNVTDLGSTNGTYINGMRIRSQTTVAVAPGSTIIFGDEHLAMFRFEEQQVHAGQSSLPPNEESSSI